MAQQGRNNLRVEAMWLLGVSIACLMGSLRACPARWKTTALKWPKMRSMKNFQRSFVALSRRFGSMAVGTAGFGAPWYDDNKSFCLHLWELWMPHLK